MRSLALALGVCILSTTATADDGLLHQPARAVVNRQALPAVQYDPGLSVEEFNRRRAARDSRQSLLVEVSVPRDQLSLQHIVDRPVQFVSGEYAFNGRIAAIFLHGDDGKTSTVQLLARIDNRQQDGAWLLQDRTIGTLVLPRHEPADPIDQDLANP